MENCVLFLSGSDKWELSEKAKQFKENLTVYNELGKMGGKYIPEEVSRIMQVAKDDYKLLTDVVLVLNDMIWDLYESNKDLAKVYNRLWKSIDMYACENLKGNELKYYLSVTD